MIGKLILSRQYYIEYRTGESGDLLVATAEGGCYTRLRAEQSLQCEA